MCDFEPIRTASENEEVIAQLEQVANMPIATIISLFAAGYRLQPSKDSLRTYCDSMINAELNTPNFVWKDIVKFEKDGNVMYSFEEARISGEMDDPNTYRVDEFIDFVADKYGIDSYDISLWSMDHFNFDGVLLDERLTLMCKTYSCGCYINGTPEWMLEY